MRTLNFENLVISKKEALRYLGVKGELSPEFTAIFNECYAEIAPYIQAKAIYEVYSVSIIGDNIDLGFAKVKSKDLAKNLQSCNKIALFVATVGMGVDRLILKYSKISPAKATIFQALGSAAVEDWCNEVNAEIQREYGACKPRFSCGYGDLEISLQKQIFSALPCEKQLGLKLLENYFIVPSKTVTAIVGIKNDLT